VKGLTFVDTYKLVCLQQTKVKWNQPRPPVQTILLPSEASEQWHDYTCIRQRLEDQGSCSRLMAEERWNLHT